MDEKHCSSHPSGVWVDFSNLNSLTTFVYCIQPSQNVSSYLVVIDSRLDLQTVHEFLYAEYFTCDPLINSANFNSFFKWFSPLISDFHSLSHDTSYRMEQLLFLLNRNCYPKYIIPLTYIKSMEIECTL